MKRLSIFATALMAVWVANPASAQPREIKNRSVEVVSQNNTVDKITPYDLVTASYQGQFTDRGIPSGSKLITATRLNQIQAEDLVRGAISTGRLSEATLSDRSYLSRVNSMLVHLSRI